jgi:actin-related protein
LRLTEQTPQDKDVCYAGYIFLLVLHIRSDLFILNHDFSDEALAKRAIFKLRYPVQDYVIVDWNSAQVFWQHYEEELQFRPEDVPVLCTEAIDTDPSIRLQMLETLFERLHVPSIHLAKTASLALVASGLTTGVVLDCGYDSTTCVAVIDGVPLKETFQKTNLAGKALTQYFVQKMMDRGIPWTTMREIEHASKIKEDMFYVPLDLSAEAAKFANDRTLARKTHGAFEGDEEIVIEDEQISFIQLYGCALTLILFKLGQHIEGACWYVNLNFFIDTCSHHLYYSALDIRPTLWVS